MQAAIKDLVIGTKFTYNSKMWEKDNNCWNSLATKDYIGTQEDNVSLVKCTPKLGGQFQPKLGQWFNENTLVEVN